MENVEPGDNEDEVSVSQKSMATRKTEVVDNPNIMNKELEAEDKNATENDDNARKESPMEVEKDDGNPEMQKGEEQREDHGITIVETTHDDRSQTPNEMKQSPEPTQDISKLLQPGRIKSLADLITVCRDGGIQIYNDTPNIPEKEKERIEELKRQGVNPDDERKQHISDHLEPNDPRRRRYDRKRKLATKTKPLADDIIVCRNEGKQVFNDKVNIPESDLKSRVDEQNDATNSIDIRHDTVSSSKSSRSRRSRQPSASSSFVSSSTTFGLADTPPANANSEDWLQERMRRRSRRRKDRNANAPLVELIQRKQQEIERQSINSRITSVQGSADDKTETPNWDINTISDNPHTEENNSEQDRSSEQHTQTKEHVVNKTLPKNTGHGVDKNSDPNDNSHRMAMNNSGDPVNDNTVSDTGSANLVSTHNSEQETNNNVERTKESNVTDSADNNSYDISPKKETDKYSPVNDKTPSSGLRNVTSSVKVTQDPKQSSGVKSSVTTNSDSETYVGNLDSMSGTIRKQSAKIENGEVNTSSNVVNDRSDTEVIEQGKNINTEQANKPYPSDMRHHSPQVTLVYKGTSSPTKMNHTDVSASKETKKNTVPKQMQNGNDTASEAKIRKVNYTPSKGPNDDTQDVNKLDKNNETGDKENQDILKSKDPIQIVEEHNVPAGKSKENSHTRRSKIGNDVENKKESMATRKESEAGKDEGIQMSGSKVTKTGRSVTYENGNVKQSPTKYKNENEYSITVDRNNSATENNETSGNQRKRTGTPQQNSTNEEQTTRSQPEKDKLCAKNTRAVLSTKSQSPEQVIEEVRIKDGTTTLVLYKVKEQKPKSKANNRASYPDSKSINNLSDQRTSSLDIGSKTNDISPESHGELCGVKTDITDELNNSLHVDTVDAHKTKLNTERSETGDDKGIHHRNDSRGTLTREVETNNDNSIDPEYKERENTGCGPSESTLNEVNSHNVVCDNNELNENHSNMESSAANLWKPLGDAQIERSTDNARPEGSLLESEPRGHVERAGERSAQSSTKSTDLKPEIGQLDDTEDNFSEGNCCVSTGETGNASRNGPVVLGSQDYDVNTSKQEESTNNTSDTSNRKDNVDNENGFDVEDESEQQNAGKIEDQTRIETHENMMFYRRDNKTLLSKVKSENTDTVDVKTKNDSVNTKNGGKVKFAIDEEGDTHSEGLRTDATDASTTSEHNRDNGRRSGQSSKGGHSSDHGSGNDDTLASRGKQKQQTTTSTSDLSTISSRSTNKGKRRASSLESWKALSSQARMILLTTKLRQDHSEQVSMSSSYLETLEETRASLRDDYNRFRRGVDMDKGIRPLEEHAGEYDGPLEDTLELEKRLQKEEREQMKQEEERRKQEIKERKEREKREAECQKLEAEKDNENKKSTIENDKGKSDTYSKDDSIHADRAEDTGQVTDRIEKEPRMDHDKEEQNSRENQMNDEQQTKQKSESENHKIDVHLEDNKELENDKDAESHETENAKVKKTNFNSDPNSDVVKSIKQKASSRLSTRWSKDHPAYEQITNGFKSESKIPDTRNVSRALLKLKNRKYNAANIREDSVYLEEAKRLTPQLFDSPYQSPKRKQLRSELRINGHKTLPDIEHPHNDGDDEYTNHKKNSPRKSGANSTSPSVDSDKSQPFSTRRREELADIYDNSRIPRHVNKRLGTQSKSLDRNQGDNLEFKSYNRFRDTESRGLKRKDSKSLDRRSGKTTDSHQRDTDVNEDANHIKSGSNGGLANASSSTVHSGKGSIDVAVDIVKSRKEFYNNGASIQENAIPREHRVMRLFREIQLMRKVVEQMDTTSGTFNDPTSGFLWMNYDVTTNRKVAKQRSDSDLRKFLYENNPYEVCSKTRNINSNWNAISGATFKRKDRALEELKSKLFTKA